MRSIGWATAGVVVAFLATPSRTLAGEEEPASPPVIVVDPSTNPPPAGTPPAHGGTGTYGADPNAGAAQPQSMAYAQPATFVPQLAEPFSAPRVRYGFSILGGVTAVGGDYAGSASGVGGASGRIGVQINRQWGVYLNEQAVIGGYILAGYDWVRTVVFASAQTSLMGSFIARDRLEIALGPSLDALAAISVDATSSATAVGAYEGTAFGLHLRAAVLLGRVDPTLPGRAGFSLSLEAHPTFFSGFTLMTLCVGLGGDWY